MLNIEYTVKYSARKTISIKVEDLGGKIVVYAPYRTTKTMIAEVVAEHADWIAKTVAKVTKRAKCIDMFRLEDGGNVWYLGQQIGVKITSSSYGYKGGYMELIAGKEDVALVRIYRKTLAEKVIPMIEKYKKSMGKSPTKVTISSARTRWGSCSSKGSINFTFRLAMAPPEVIEYVVAHEMAHLFEMNHSSRFYALVTKHYGDIKPAVKWLKENGALLTLL